MFVRAVSEARSQMERVMYAAIDIHYFGDMPAREHKEIVEAIQERNHELARKRMYDHIIQSKDNVLRVASYVPSRH
jgi:DNA-binding FadR family transcriptional regulator